MPFPMQLAATKSQYDSLRSVASMILPLCREEETRSEMAKALSQRSTAYVHLYFQPTYVTAPQAAEKFKADFRESFGGTIIAAGGFSRDIAEERLNNNEVDWLRLVCHLSPTRIWLKE